MLGAVTRIPAQPSARDVAVGVIDELFIVGRRTRARTSRRTGIVGFHEAVDAVIFVGRLFALRVSQRRGRTIVVVGARCLVGLVGGAICGLEERRAVRIVVTGFDDPIR